METWHAVTGKISILWSEATLGGGVERPVYEKWLRWYGKEIRNGLWWPLLKAHRLHREALAGADGSDNGAVAGSEDSDGNDDEAELEED